MLCSRTQNDTLGDIFEYMTLCDILSSRYGNTLDEALYQNGAGHHQACMHVANTSVVCFAALQ